LKRLTTSVALIFETEEQLLLKFLSEGQCSNEDYDVPLNSATFMSPNLPICEPNPTESGTEYEWFARLENSYIKN